MADHFHHDTASLLALLHQGPLEEPCWNGFLVALRQQMEANAANIVLQMPSGEQKGIYTADSDFNDEIADKNLKITRDKYEEKYAPLSPFPYEIMRDNSLNRLEDVVTRKEFKSSRFYKEFCQPLDFEYQVCLVIVIDNGYRAYLHLTRGREKGNFPTESSALLMQLLPHLQISLRLYAELQFAKQNISVCNQMLDQLGVGIILLNMNSELLWQNPTAEKQIKESSNFQLKRKKFSITRIEKTGHKKHENPTWQSLVTDLLTSDDSFRCAAFTIEGDNPIGVLVRHWQNSLSVPDKLKPSLVITMIASGVNNPLNTVLIGQLFNLTPSEAKLAAQLTQGASLTEAANNLYITVSSARTYCKRIYAKTGVKRQTELVSLIRNSVAYIS